jgi:hypothetical protein
MVWGFGEGASARYLNGELVEPFTTRSSKEAQAEGSLAIDYTAWNIWKERNMRVFKGLASLPHRILSIIKEEIRLRYLACGGDEPLLLT